MSRVVFKLPDLGEGTVSAEIVSWHVKPGDTVSEGQTIAELSTEKAVVELPSPVTGCVLTLNGQPGEQIAVGGELIVFEHADPGGSVSSFIAAQPQPESTPVSPSSAAAATKAPAARRVMASPATRRRAREAGLDLTQVTGSGAGGRIQLSDLHSALNARPAPKHIEPTPPSATEEIKVIGVRRVIAQRMSEAKRSIPHFSYVEEVDVTELEALRQHLNAQPDTPKFTLLPFIIAALVRTLKQFPQCNAIYDAARETIIRHRAVHVGIATQTRDGLKVPVVRHAQSLSLRPLSEEIRRVCDAARTNRATRDELSGSTITVTSLGKLGGIATTPVINAPEVSIIGVNRMLERPVVHGGSVAVRRMMNLSSSFDHRFVDGFDAAAMIQALKSHLENPATLFMPD